MAVVDPGATMLADLDLLLIGVFGTADDLLPDQPKNVADSRPRRRGARHGGALILPRGSPMTWVMRRGRSPVPGRWSRVPLPVLGALVVLLAAGPLGLVLSESGSRQVASATVVLGEIARRAGCALSEFDRDPGTNPPVSGRVDERITARDGSYVGRRSPSIWRPRMRCCMVAWSCSKGRISRPARSIGSTGSSAAGRGAPCCSPTARGCANRSPPPRI
jgi:hypothetical protein